MKAVLPLYLVSWLRYSEPDAIKVIHSFNFAAYFFTLIGGIISDMHLGKYKTILRLSVVYCIGSTILASTSLRVLHSISRLGTFIGLTLLAIGTGGIKPCVASFGGDQFEPTQTTAIEFFFSVFYFTINAGSVLSMLITPILRNNFKW